MGKIQIHPDLRQNDSEQLKHAEVVFAGHDWCPNDMCNEHYRSRNVMRGHQQFLAIHFD